MGKVQREQRRNKNKCYLLLKDGDTTTNYDADSIVLIIGTRMFIIELLQVAPVQR